MSTPIFPYLVLPRLETEVAGREIKLLVEQRIIGNVHLAIDAEQRAVRVDDRRRVVINARRALLEERGDDHHLVFLRELLKRVGARAGNRFGQFEVFVVFALAEILRAKQFLRADDLRAVFREPLCFRERAFQILGGILGTARLNQTDVNDVRFFLRQRFQNSFGKFVARRRAPANALGTHQ